MKNKTNTLNHYVVRTMEKNIKLTIFTAIFLGSNVLIQFTKRKLNQNLFW